MVDKTELINNYNDFLRLESQAMMLSNEIRNRRDWLSSNCTHPKAYVANTYMPGIFEFYQCRICLHSLTKCVYEVLDE